MTTKPLTETQKKVLRFIARHIDRLGFQPSYSEIADYMGWTCPASTRFCLRAIERKGVVVLNRHEARAVQFKWKLWIRRRGK